MKRVAWSRSDGKAGGIARIVDSVCDYEEEVKGRLD